MSDRPWVLLGAGLGGAAGYYLGRKNIAWAAVGVIAGITVVPAIAQAAISQLPPSPQVQTHVIQLVPGRTIILRANVGDLVTVLAPSGWGVPSATSNVPGFLQIQSTSTVTESDVLSVQAAGQGQISMSSGGETAVLSIEATAQ